MKLIAKATGAKKYPTIFVSAGRRGLEIELKPKDLFISSWLIMTTGLTFFISLPIAHTLSKIAAIFSNQINLEHHLIP